MAGSKRFNRHGLIISALGHVGLLAIGLLFLRASAHEAVPPDATLVELVTPQEMPRFSGTPSALRASGAPTQAAAQPPMRAQNLPPQPEQKQQQDQRKAERDLPPKTKPPPMTSSDAGQLAVPPPQPPDPQTASSAETPDAADVEARMAQLAQLALVGGRLGGGFAAPPINSSLVGYDYTLAFRERVSSCSPLPPGIDRRDKISVGLRIFLNPDGTLTKPPELLEGNLSAKQRVLFENFVNGLTRCQPYTMLPADKYKQWKVFDVMVFPMDSYGG